ncbi:hypothetical protein FOMPIDRAFT_1050537 [Fomitopsis schrenkii]|uniref:F-box domain-containing protein n=1 Tax=Fomitopsis schrenkii TaxID=2126942 RepID=S8FMG5_FOMSC|nr:hypothetical protein FOMPIDRAFT_1050537 [Fomitopsis schrenkii]
MDVWEYTVDFLWYDPPSLLACALACRAWARRSRFLLQRETTLTIRSAKDMRMYGHLLASKRSRKLFAKIRILRIIDDPTSPFVHTLPLILPGQHLPEVATVVLENINWTISSPHITFFRKLSQFAELTSICLHRCILRPVSHAMRLLRTLPRLQSAVEGQRGAACLPRDAVSFDCVLIGTEIDVESHQHMHPGVKHKTLQQAIEACLRPNPLRSSTLPPSPIQAAPKVLAPRRADSAPVGQWKEPTNTRDGRQTPREEDTCHFQEPLVAVDKDLNKRRTSQHHSPQAETAPAGMPGSELRAPTSWTRMWSRPRGSSINFEVDYALLDMGRRFLDCQSEAYSCAEARIVK